VSKALFRTISKPEIDFEQITNTLSSVSTILECKSVLEKDSDIEYCIGTDEDTIRKIRSLLDNKNKDNSSSKIGAVQEFHLRESLNFYSGSQRCPQSL
jgi:hypothetical protein